ncbi:hypothetical protein SAMN05216388_105514 [Halorientalis persicus]|uniref:Uncharacterized protein n=1 Tax=Halorientalis persicus TaxID=1367881 RepID=A0A1H8WEF6_9EURY|nr:hypothetical protein [Halorientalis persicus]SEP25518.1 hypothetical protein SAMN05216388_105514 [Halorientalis persicus]
MNDRHTPELNDSRASKQHLDDRAVAPNPEQAPSYRTPDDERWS